MGSTTLGFLASTDFNSFLVFITSTRFGISSSPVEIKTPYNVNYFSHNTDLAKQKVNVFKRIPLKSVSSLSSISLKSIGPACR